MAKQGLALMGLILLLTACGDKIPPKPCTLSVVDYYFDDITGWRYSQRTLCIIKTRPVATPQQDTP